VGFSCTNLSLKHDVDAATGDHTGTRRPSAAFLPWNGCQPIRSRLSTLLETLLFHWRNWLHVTDRLLSVGRGERISTNLWLEDLGFETIQAQKRPDRLWRAPKPILTGIWFLATGIKRLVRGVDHSPPTSSKVKNEWSYTHSSPYVFRTWNRINFSLYFQVRIALPCNDISAVTAEDCAGYIRVPEGI
jgi:hypothetical protein